MKANYHELIKEQAGVVDDTEKQQLEQRRQEEQAVKRTLKVQWLQEDVTQQMFKGIIAEANELDRRARELAFNFNLNNDHLEIINLLVRSQQLRNIKDKYGN